MPPPAKVVQGLWASVGWRSYVALALAFMTWREPDELWSFRQAGLLACLVGVESFHARRGWREGRAWERLCTSWFPVKE